LSIKEIIFFESFLVHSDQLYFSGKKIILDLLEKYRADGIDSVVDPKVFDIPPFDKMGHVMGVAEKVGGIENLKKIISRIESDLYKND